MNKYGGSPPSLVMDNVKYVKLKKKLKVDMVLVKSAPAQEREIESV